MPALIHETQIAWGKARQSDVATPSAEADLWRMLKLNTDFAGLNPVLENNEDWIGKGYPYASDTFFSHWDSSFSLNKFCSVEFLIWAFAMAMGKVDENLNVYTITPIDPIVDLSIELPYWTFVEQVRPGGGAIIDRLLTGSIVDNVEVTIQAGPGLQTATATVSCFGTGKYTTPSGIDMPTVTMVQETNLNASGAEVTLLGTDYVAIKGLESLTFGWRNNATPDTGFYIGSGFQTPGDANSGAIRGRMEYGRQEAYFSFTARAEPNDPALAALLAQTEGTAVIKLVADPSNDFQMTYHKVRYTAAQPGAQDQLIVVNAESTPLYDPANGIATVVANSPVTGIGQ